MGTPDVNVANTAATPVLVREVDNAAMQPFQQELLLSTPDGLLGAGDEFTLPDGKRLVIEFVSFDGTWPAGQHTTRLFIGVCNASGNSCPASFHLAPAFETTEFGGNVFFAASSMTRLYADPGTEVSVDVRRNTTGGTGLASVAISGYLVGVP